MISPVIFIFTYLITFTRNESQYAEESFIERNLNTSLKNTYSIVYLFKIIFSFRSMDAVATYSEFLIA